MSIKNYISIIILLLIQFNLSAQKDTAYQTIRQENGEYNAPLIETPADRAFRTKVPSKWMFKMNLAQTILSADNRTNSRALFDGIIPLGFAAEYKLSPGFSIGAYFGMALNVQPESNYNGPNKWVFANSFSVESRWYHDMKKRIQKGKSANNFGGRYLALETGISNLTPILDPWGYKKLILRYGLQQRFMRNGYFDISVGAGLTQSSAALGSTRWLNTDQRIAVGLAAFLPKSRSARQSGGLCDVLHCQDEQQKMLKINLFDVLNFRSNGSAFSLNIKPNIAFEHKIGRSPFSVEADLSTRFEAGRYEYSIGGNPTEYETNNRAVYWNASGELRWYYNMRKRILKGSSGNNLSGSFISLNLNRNNLIKNTVSYRSNQTNSGNINFHFFGDYWACNLFWGIQQRLLDRGFVQFKIGAGSTFGSNYYRYNGAGKPMTKIGLDNDLNILADLKVGFAF